MPLDIKKLKIDEIVLFQFKKKDKHKLYNHAKKSGLNINMFSKDDFLLCIYLPKKKITETDLIIDNLEAESFIRFVRQIKNNGIQCHIKVYGSHRHLSLNN